MKIFFKNSTLLEVGGRTNRSPWKYLFGCTKKVWSEKSVLSMLYLGVQTHTPPELRILPLSTTPSEILNSWISKRLEKNLDFCPCFRIFMIWKLQKPLGTLSFPSFKIISPHTYSHDNVNEGVILTLCTCREGTQIHVRIQSCFWLLQQIFNSPKVPEEIKENWYLSIFKLQFFVIYVEDSFLWRTDKDSIENRSFIDCCVSSC